MKTTTRLIALLLITLLATPAIGQKLYRWVDKDGNVHYSDQVPPDEIDKARDELNSKGRLVERVGVAASQADIEALGAEERVREEERLRLIQEVESDRIIEAVYADEDEIIRKRERKLAGLDLSIRNANTFIATQEDSLTSLKKRKTKVESEGDQVSDALQSMLDNLEHQVTQQQEVLEIKTREREKVISFYDHELATYRAMLKRKEIREAQAKASG